MTNSAAKIVDVPAEIYRWHPSQRVSGVEELRELPICGVIYKFYFTHLF
jgi:hypothetical protein